MRNLSLILFLILSISVYTQDDKQKNPNVELPDFVITGSDVIRIKKAEKIKPDFISTISEDFLKPAFSPEQLEVKDLSNPLRSDLQFLDTSNFYKGSLDLGIGIYSIPEAGFAYAQPFKNGIFEGTFDGTYQRAYIDNSDRYSARGGLNLLYWIDIENNFLPGTQFDLSGDYGSSDFKLFASDIPEQKRTIVTGNAALEINNFFNDYFNFSVKLSDEYTSIDQEKFSEQFIRLLGHGRLNLASIYIGADLDYRQQILDTDSVDNFLEDFLLVRPTVGVQITKILKGKFGYTFANSKNETFTSPYISLAVNLDRSISFFGEYAPQPELKGNGYYLRSNDYFNPHSQTSIYFEKSNAYNLSVKYEYDKYFQVDGGLKYFSSKMFPYFIPDDMNGLFKNDFAEVKNFNPYIDFIFYLGPYGIFFSSAELQHITDEQNNSLPYYYKYKVDASYGYNFDNGIDLKTGVSFISSRYTDIENTTELDPFIDLNFEVSYNLQPDLDLWLKAHNLLNNDNFYWAGYKELPVNVIAGFSYRF